MTQDEKQNFDFESFKKDAAARLKKGDGLLGKDGLLTPLLKDFLEEALNGELEGHLEADEQPNRKNGKGSKLVNTDMGQIEIRYILLHIDPGLFSAIPAMLTPLFSIGCSVFAIKSMAGKPITMAQRCFIPKHIYKVGSIKHMTCGLE